MHVAYTIAFDSPGTGGHRLLAKMLAMSMVRSRFDGEFIIFRNTPAPIFQVAREGITERYVPTRSQTALRMRDEAWCWKYLVAPEVAARCAETGAERVLFLDADILCLRNPDHLLDGDWDIAYSTEERPITAVCWSAYLSDGEMGSLKRKGINSGAMAVRAGHYEQVMAEWRQAHSAPPVQNSSFLEQAAWNRVILDTTLRARPFERDAVMYPLNADFDYRIYREATFVHCLGDDLRTKVQFMFGLYMSTFYLDDHGTMLSLLEM